MEIVELLDALRIAIDDAKPLPLTRKKLIDTDEILDIIDQIDEVLPKEIESAQKIIDQRGNIIAEAAKEAEVIVKEAERRMVDMIDDHEITRKAQERGNKLVEDAKEQARDICQNAIKYGNSEIEKCEKIINELNVELKKKVNDIENLQMIISENKKLYNAGE